MGVKFTIADGLTIAKAYGEDFEELKDHIDETGSVPEEVFIDHFGTWLSHTYEITVKFGITTFRPISLRGFKKEQ